MPPQDTAEQHLTIRDVRKALNVSRTTAYRLAHSGQLRAFRVGRALRVPASGLDEYLRNNTLTPAPAL